MTKKMKSEILAQKIIITESLKSSISLTICWRGQKETSVKLEI